MKGSKTTKKSLRPNAGTEARLSYLLTAVAQPALSQSALVTPDMLEDVFRLIVQGERQEVILRIVAEVAGLVYENREFPHAKPLPDKENAGRGIPRSLIVPRFQVTDYLILSDGCRVEPWAVHVLKGKGFVCARCLTR